MFASMGAALDIEGHYNIGNETVLSSLVDDGRMSFWYEDKCLLVYFIFVKLS